jgi:hypothetical protein
VLLRHGADPNARDRGDNASALHFAAANGYLETVRALLDAGGDVHGSGDLHDGDVIGWAVGNPANRSNGVLALLRQRGARHHIFSAIAMGDAELVRSVVAENPDALHRRRSRFEQHQTPLHYALASPDGLQSKSAQYDMVDLLIALGADVDAPDGKGRTALELALLHGDLEAVRRLKTAGAREPQVMDAAVLERRQRALQDLTLKPVPMLCVDDVDATVAWYGTLGFQLRARHPESGLMGWASLVHGSTEVMVQHRVGRPRNQIALWYYTDRIDELYQLLRGLQFRTILAGNPDPSRTFAFLEDLYEPFYGGRQFSIRDNSGFEVVFRAE